MKQRVGRRQPERSCVGCRSVRPKRELVRIVRTPTGEVVIDSGNERLPGRGAYICHDEKCFQQALQGKALERALKAPLPAGIGEQLSQLLAEETSVSPREGKPSEGG